MVKPGKLFRAPKTQKHGPLYRERFTPEAANLQFLSSGEYEIPPGGHTDVVSYGDQEALVFMWRGAGSVAVGSVTYALNTYDVLYIPKGADHSISNHGHAPAKLFLTRAPASNVHPAFHSKFAEIRRDETRIRHLKGKDVFLMFDVSEPADKLVAGYTFFEPFARSWPPHNHTDQEEVYIFIKGRGAMEVYESPETLTFVREVAEGDAVTIPLLNYHPVFSQEASLEFIWCIAGERYWVGDKNKDFMKGGSASITT